MFGFEDMLGSVSRVTAMGQNHKLANDLNISF